MLNLIAMKEKSEKYIFTGGRAKKDDFLDLLLLLRMILFKIVKDGLISIDPDLEDPKKSEIFSRFKSILADKPFFEFIADNLMVIVTTDLKSSHILNRLIDIDIESRFYNVGDSFIKKVPYLLVKEVLLAHIEGCFTYSYSIAPEFGRRAIPLNERPSYEELEQATRK
jgi:flagellar motor component MotA